MNKTIHYLLFSVLGLMIAGCSYTTKVNCINKPKTYFLFYTADTADRIVYTGYSLGAYKPGTSFATQEYFAPPVSDTDTFRYSYMRIDNPYLVSGFDQHDWIITFYPSGRQFKIWNITRHPERKKMMNSLIEDGVKCVNGFSYYLNDTLVSVPAEASSQLLQEQYVRIKY